MNKEGSVGTHTWGPI